MGKRKDIPIREGGRTVPNEIGVIEKRVGLPQRGCDSYPEDALLITIYYSNGGGKEPIDSVIAAVSEFSAVSTIIRTNGSGRKSCYALEVTGPHGDKVIPESASSILGQTRILAALYDVKKYRD